MRLQDYLINIVLMCFITIAIGMLMGVTVLIWKGVLYGL